MKTKEKQLLFQAMVEILECFSKQPNKYTQRRLIKELSEIAYPNSLLKPSPLTEIDKEKKQ